MKADWDVDEELGEGKLEAIVTDLYDQMFDDILIGFLFRDSHKPSLIESQQEWVRAHIGRRAVKWTGPSIRTIHRQLPILVGHFDRRHFILRQLMEKHDVPQHVADAWLGLDAALRTLVLNVGAQQRDALLQESTYSEKESV